jgi:hypothetical protein
MAVQTLVLFGDLDLSWEGGGLVGIGSDNGVHAVSMDPGGDKKHQRRQKHQEENYFEGICQSKAHLPSFQNVKIGTYQ